MIVGVSGRKRSGKDSIGAALVQELGFERVAFADGVKDLTAKVFKWDLPWVIHDAFKPLRVAKIVNPGDVPFFEDITGREVLQRIGNGVREVIGDDTWIRLALAQCADQGLCSNCGNPKNGDTLQTMTMYHGAPVPYCHAEGSTPDEIFTSVKHYVITDVRYPNEFAAIKAAGGLVIRTNRADREGCHDFIDNGADACTQKVKNDIGHLRAQCKLPPAAHPTHDSGDWHPSEVSLPDESNASITYDAVFTGDQSANVAAARAFIAEKIK